MNELNNKQSKLTEIQADTTQYMKSYWENVNKKREDIVSIIFPNWNKEDYVEFVREWKETYRVHSEYARLEKRFRKTVHNVITNEEKARYWELEKHESFAPQSFYNGYNIARLSQTQFYEHSNKVRARFLLAIRKAGKIWAAKAYEESRNPKQQAA